MTATTNDDQPSWTELGVRMGFTAEAVQRTEILDAVERITSSQTPGIPPYFDGPAARAIITALTRHRDHVRMVGIAQLDAHRRLIGLQDTLGTRRFVLDLDVEAILLLTKFGRPPNNAANQQRHMA